MFSCIRSVVFCIVKLSTEVVVFGSDELTKDNVSSSVLFCCAVVAFCSAVFVGVNDVLSDSVNCTPVLSDKVTVLFCELVGRRGCAVVDCVLLNTTGGAVKLS